jgi:hypothetical protein
VVISVTTTGTPKTGTPTNDQATTGSNDDATSGLHIVA